MTAGATRLECHFLKPPAQVAASARVGYGRADLLEAVAADFLVTPTAMRRQLQQLSQLPGADNTFEIDIAADACCDPLLHDDVAE